MKSKKHNVRKILVCIVKIILQNSIGANYQIFFPSLCLEKFQGFKETDFEKMSVINILLLYTVDIYFHFFSFFRQEIEEDSYNV